MLKSSELTAHYTIVQRYALKLTRDADKANDLTQDVMERALKYSYTFKEGTNLKSWLLRITRNHFVSERRRKRFPHVEISTVIDSLGVDPPQTKATEANDLGSSLNSLRKRDQEILRLVFWEEMAMKEIGIQLELAEGSVKSRIFRAKQNLRIAFES